MATLKQTLDELLTDVSAKIAETEYAASWEIEELPPGSHSKVRLVFRINGKEEINSFYPYNLEEELQDIDRRAVLAGLSQMVELWLLLEHYPDNILAAIRAVFDVYSINDESTNKTDD